jgi:DedD protein
LSLDFMAFFKFRQRDDEAAAPSGPLESVEVLRKRAKHRLMGTVVLVLAGVIGFPLLVDKQPRPIAVDIPIEIPDKNKVKPLALPSVAPQVVPEANLPASAPVVVPPLAPKPEPKDEAKPVEKIAEKEPAKVIFKEAPKEVAKPIVKEPAKTPEKTAEKAPEKAPEKPLGKPVEKSNADSAARAQALLDGKEPPAAAVPASTAAAEDRLVVQVGAFADAAKAREARLKLERAGLKTYTQEVQTKDGLRIRVRVGPFGSRAEADKAADKIKKLDLSAAILTL